MQNIPATIDDTTGSDDEDGVTLPDFAAPSETFNIDVVLTKDADTTLTGLQLFAWIDWNRDGDWNDAGEQIINNATAAEGNKYGCGNRTSQVQALVILTFGFVPVQLTPVVTHQ